MLQFEREDVPKPSERIASLEKDPAISATETTTKSTMTPRAEKQKNLALLKELANETHDKRRARNATPSGAKVSNLDLAHV